MMPNRSDHDNRDSSRPRNPRHHRDSRNHRDRDSSSVDSGYWGSSAAASLQIPQKGVPSGQQPASPRRRPEMPKYDADKGSDASWEDSDSDSDYDPKAKYYLKVDDDAYRDMSFPGGEPSGRPRSGKGKERRRETKGDSLARRPRSDHDRRGSTSHRRHSTSSSDTTDPRALQSDRSRRPSSRRHSESSRPRRDSYHRTLSPIPSEKSDGWQTSPERSHGSRIRSLSHISRPRRTSSADSLSDTGSVEPEVQYLKAKSQSSPERPRRPRTRDDDHREGSHQRGRSGSSSYTGAADMDDAWFKTFKERITKGVDMNQVKKVGLDAAAVAAVKVAVGTQVPWKQRIPKTIAVGLAAAVTDFLVSKTSFQPKGMVGTMFARQFVEIALANLVINPVSTKVTGAAQKAKGKVQGGSDQAGSGGRNQSSGGRGVGGGGVGGGGRGRR